MQHAAVELLGERHEQPEELAKNLRNAKVWTSDRQTVVADGSDWIEVVDEKAGIESAMAIKCAPQWHYVACIESQKVW